MADSTEPKKGWLQEFKEFATTGDLMSVAVAFIMGLAVKALIDSFVKDIVMGTVGLVVKCDEVVDEATKKVTKDCTGITGKAYETLAYGRFLNEVVNFLIIAFVIFWIVKMYKKATKRQLAQDGPTDVDILIEIRDELRARRDG